MGIAAYRVWRLGLALKLVRLGLSLFGIQLVLNALWSALFFGQQNIGGALVEISFLWVAILATILAFGRVDKKAALLLVPYLLWVSFATYLNASLYLLN